MLYRTTEEGMVMSRFTIESPVGYKECQENLEEIAAGGELPLEDLQWDCAQGGSVAHTYVEAESEEQCLTMAPSGLEGTPRCVMLD